MRLPDSMIWWGGWPWRWRFYFKTIHRGPNGFVGLLLGPVEFLWSQHSLGRLLCRIGLHKRERYEAYPINYGSSECKRGCGA